LGEHAPAPFQLLGLTQETCVTCEQAPVEGLQHAPGTGCGQGFGEHAAEPFQMSGPLQAEKKTSEHAPVLGVQHAPAEVED
jgi:hypothetical protein